MEWILMRHGTTQGNLEHRFIGVTDLPLIAEGEELARQVSPTLPEVEHLYVSPLLRCRQTAALLWPGVRETLIPAIRETDFGPFEGKNHEELKDDPMYQRWLDGHTRDSVPVGESSEECAARLAEGAWQIMQDAEAHGYRRIGVVSHGGSIMGLLSQFGKPERDYYGWIRPNCGGYRLAAEKDPFALRVLEEYGN